MTSYALSDSQPGFLILAAGRSQRFGNEDKLLVPLQGKPLIAHVLDTLQQLALPRNRVVVCVAPNATPLTDYLSARDQAFTRCPHADAGMGSTLADGVSAHADWPGWIICLADMPAISAATYHALLTHPAPHGILAPSWQGQRGHPVRIDQRFRQALCNLQGDTGARHLLAQYNDDLALLSVEDPGITLDIDTPSDLNRRLIL